MAKDNFKAIEELAMDCLIDLVDKEFKLTIKQLTGYTMIKLIPPSAITWGRLKEDYLFFLQMMSDYKLVGRFPFSITHPYSVATDYTLEMLMKMEDGSDEYSDQVISSITVFIG